MPRLTATLLAACGMGCWLMLCAPASAQPGEGDAPSSAEDETEYRSLVGEAVSQSAAGHYPEALALFIRAHALRPSARTLRGIGLVRFGLADYAGSIRALEASLTDERRPLEAAHRQEAQDTLERANRYVARVAVELVPPDAEITVDGSQLVLPDDHVLLLNPGRHEIRFEREGFVDEARSLAIEGGGRQRLEVELRAVGATNVGQSPSSSVSVNVRSDPVGLVFHAHPMSAPGDLVPNVVSEVCVAPCSAQLAPRLYRFAFGAPAETPTPVGEYRLDFSVDLTIHYDDREWFRVAGWIVGGTFLLGSAALLSTIAAVTSEGPAIALGILGASSFAVGLAVGIPLIFLEDATALELRPLQAD